MNRRELLIGTVAVGVSATFPAMARPILKLLEPGALCFSWDSGRFKIYDGVNWVNLYEDDYFTDTEAPEGEQEFIDWLNEG